MKNRFIDTALVVAMIVLTVFVARFCFSPIDLEGEILVNMQFDSEHKLAVYDCDKQTVTSTGLHASPGAYVEKDKIVLNKDLDVILYDLKTKDSEVLCRDMTADFITGCGDSSISISTGYSISLYNLYNKTLETIVLDNGSKMHSWSKDGKTLYYSNDKMNIIALDTENGTSRVIASGHSPVESNGYLAYYNDGLFVLDLNSGLEIRYNPPAAHSYCFSPDGEYLLIEGNISWYTFIGNLVKNDVVFGSSIVAWDFKNNKRTTVVDACVSMPNLICDWQS